MSNAPNPLALDPKIKFLLCSFVDLNGLPKAKLVPAEHWDDLLREGASFAGFAAGDFAQGPHDPDLVNIPDASGLTTIPWRPDTAWIPGRLYVEGKPWPYCSRGLLVDALAKAREAGFVLQAGTEPEFMLLKKEAERFTPWDPLDNAAKPCYDLSALHRNLNVITELMGCMQELGWDPYAGDHEDANCQFEINWKYADALTTADRQTFFKWMVRSLAEKYGLTATFMPKPFPNLTGNGAHLHLSLSDPRTGSNLFANPDLNQDLSPLARLFLGGILKHARALSAIVAPTVNSYKRLTRNHPRSGSTWAPIAVTYGRANRTQMIRIPAPGRLEVRAVDGSANPYLALTALLAAGLDGIQNRTEPGEANDGNLFEKPLTNLELLPANLGGALDCLEADTVILSSLGAEYGPYYLEVKREEWRQYHSDVSSWEVARYISC